MMIVSLPAHADIHGISADTPPTTNIAALRHDIPVEKGAVKAAPLKAEKRGSAYHIRQAISKGMTDRNAAHCRECNEVGVVRLPSVELDV